MAAKKKYLIVIGGATATGKTALAIEVARYFRAEIISADSRQFFREMSIGTAKPSGEELAAVPHHFINSHHIFEDYSVGDFEKEALTQLERLFQKTDIAVLTGGSGLFIRALCEGLDAYPEVPKEVVESLETTFQLEGIAALQAELRQSDPVYFERVDQNNPQRLIRALSVCRVSGRPFSSFQQQERTDRPFTPVYILLQMEREQLYARINRRVDAMMTAGLLEEVKTLYPHRHLNALQTVGYQELFDYLDGRVSLEEAIEKIKQNSRRYAKRQMTWFRKDPHWKAFRPEDKELIISYLENKTAL